MGGTPNIPEVRRPPPPPNAPRQADASVIGAANPRRNAAIGRSSLIGSGPQGLRSRAQTTRRRTFGGGGGTP